MGGTGIASADSYLGYLWNPAAINIFSGGENIIFGLHTAFNFGGMQILTIIMATECLNKRLVGAVLDIIKNEIWIPGLYF